MASTPTAPTASTMPGGVMWAAATCAAAAAVFDAPLKLGSAARGPFGWAHGPRGDTWVGTNMLRPSIGHRQHAAADGYDGGGACARRMTSNQRPSQQASVVIADATSTAATSMPTVHTAGISPWHVIQAAATRADAAVVLGASLAHSCTVKPHTHSVMHKRHRALIAGTHASAPPGPRHSAARRISRRC